MSTQLPDPDHYRLPTVRELEEHRRDLELSKREFSERAGFKSNRWVDIQRRDSDPPLSTIRAFVDVLRDADPDGDRKTRGRGRTITEANP